MARKRDVPRRSRSWHVAMLTCGILPGTGPVAAQSAPPPSLFDLSLNDLMNVRIVSTARKREEVLLEVPVSVTVFTEQDLQDYDIHSFLDYSGKTPNLAFAYGNAFTVGNPSTGISTARSISIRGLSGARTTGFYIDDTPLPSSIDVRLVDLSRVEVLKGPQGTLYGESSLGGNVRLIANTPDLEHTGFRYRIEAGDTSRGGKLDSGAEAVGNLVLSPDRAALRLAASLTDSAGFITRSYLSDLQNPGSPHVSVGNQGAQRTAFGSLTGLFQVTEAFQVSLKCMYQDLHDHGFPAAWAPLPAFEPVLDMGRVADLQPEADDTWSLPALTLSYVGKGWTLTSSTSYFERSTKDREDSTEGTLQIYQGRYPVQPFAWTGRSKGRQWAHETRVVFDPIGRVSFTAGVFLARYKTDYSIPPEYERSTGDLLWVESETNTQKNQAVFGEAYIRFLETWTLTLGFRQYWLNQQDQHTVLLGNVNDTTYGDNGSRGLSPKFALSCQLDPNAMIYASATKGFRQGNSQLNPDLLGGGPELATHGQTAGSYLKIRPDSAWSYEVGGKFMVPDPGLKVSTSLFHIDVKNFQQQVLLKSIGLFLQGNAGEAAIDGAELELSGNLARALKVRFGLGYESAHITKAGNTFQPEGSPVYHAPRWTATLGGVYSKPLNEALKFFLSVDASCTGKSLSGNSGTDLTQPSYSLADLRTGLEWRRSQLALSIKNATNARPNFGDITYVGYGLFTDATRSTPVPQVATLQPLTVMIQYSERF